MQAFQNLQRHVDLALSAVHQDQIRKSGKSAQLPAFLPLPKPVGKPPCEHLPHASIVVRAFDAFDLELPVIIALRFSPFVNHHGTHGLESVGIGNIKGLHPADPFESQQPSDLLHRPNCAPFLPLEPFLVLAQNKLRVTHRQLHQLFLGSFFRNPERDLRAPPAGKPLLNQLPVLWLLRQHQLSRNKGSPSVILLDEAVQDAADGFLFGNPQIKMVPADEPASPDKEDLYDRILFLRGRRQDIPVLPAGVRDLLLLGHLFHTVHQFPVFNGLFKFQRFRSRVHLPFQLRENPLIMPVQKPYHL